MFLAFHKLSVRKETVLALVLIMFSNQFVGSGLTTFSSEITCAKLGETISLGCISKSNLADVEWYHQKIGSTQDRTVYLEGNIYLAFRGRFSVPCNEGTGECCLRISNVNSSDAGKYNCKHNDVTTSIELIVFEVYPSNKSCSMSNDYNKPIIGRNACNILPATVVISCKMKYYGNKVPEMVWTDDSKKVTLNSSLSKDERNDVTSSTVQLIANSTTKITCTILFLAPSVTSKISWTTGFTVKDLLNSSTTNETNCSSDDQICQVVEDCLLPQWTLLNGTFINSSETLVLKDLKSGHYECNSFCTVRRQNCVIRQRTVIHFCNTHSGSETKTSSNTATAVGIAIGAVLVVAAVGVVAAVFIQRKKKLANPGRRPNAEPADKEGNAKEDSEPLNSR